jgi:hypothetical protein
MQIFHPRLTLDHGRGFARGNNDECAGLINHMALDIEGMKHPLAGYDGFVVHELVGGGVSFNGQFCHSLSSIDGNKLESFDDVITAAGAAIKYAISNELSSA